MAIDFPAGTSVGQTFEANNVTYTWDGAKWTAGSSKTSEALFVNKSGDSMTGALVLPGDPQSDYQAATKKYVDENGGGGGGGGGGGTGGTTKADIYGTAKAYAHIVESEITGTTGSPSMDGIYNSRGIVGIGKISNGKYFIDFEPGLFKDINYILSGTATIDATRVGFIQHSDERIGVRTPTRIYIAVTTSGAYASPKYLDLAFFDNEPAEIIVGSGTVANTNIYGTAKAWGRGEGDGTLLQGQNIASVTRTAGGEYDVVFVTPMSNSDYAVNVTTSSDNQRTTFSKDQTATGFTFGILQSSGAGTDAEWSFTVFDNTPAEVALTTFGDVVNYSGAAAWGTFDGSSPNGLKPLLGGLNIASVERQSTGSYVITFINPMPDNNYSVTATGLPGICKVNKDNKTTTSFVLGSNNVTTNNPTDCHSINFVVQATNALPPQGGTGTDSWATVDKTTVNGPCNVPASFNVASVTRTAKGMYDVVFTTPMPTANYAVTAQVTSDTGVDAPVIGVYAITATGFSIRATNTVNTIERSFCFAVNATNATLPQTVTQEQIEAAINNPGASAWGDIETRTSGGLCTIYGAMNVSSVTRSAKGTYDIVFATPMPSDAYSITASSTTQNNQYDNVTPFGFRLLLKNSSGLEDAGEFSFVVFATNALPPKGGTGTDCWGTVDKTQANGPCNVPGSFNVASVTRTAKGKYDVLFTSPMPSSNYAVNGSVFGVGGSTIVAPFISAYNITATGFSLATFVGDFSPSDRDFSFTVNATNATLPSTITQEEVDLILDAIKNGISGNGGGSGGPSAWGTFGGDVPNGPVPLISGLNIQSVERTGPGAYLIDFVTPMPDAKYCVTATGRNVVFKVNNDNKTTTGFELNSTDPVTNSPSNATSTNFVVHSSTALGGTGTDAWGYIDENGDLAAGLNCTVVKTGKSGERQVTFDTPMPNANYSVTTGIDFEWAGIDATAIVSTYNKTENGFTIRPKRGAAFNDNIPASFAVHASNVSLPFTVTQTQIESFKTTVTALEAAVARIQSLEAKVQTLETDHTTLMNNDNGGGY